MVERRLIGYVGVIDGKPVFETVSDAHGDALRLEVFKSAAEALERWAYARKVTITLGEEVAQSRRRGHL